MESTVFCDLSTPQTEWNAYDELRDKLVQHGMDPARVAFVHDANNDAKKDRLFAECRSGGLDVLIGSTPRMGVGTNIQTRAVALHHLDCPWRPADVEQRDGRIIRQGNQLPEVQILRYVVEGSFDAYMWQTVERKAKFIDQVMHGDLQTRSADDISSAQSLSYNEIKAAASGNPLLLEKAEADQALAKLENLARAHQRDQTYRSGQITSLTATLGRLEESIAIATTVAQRSVDTKGDQFTAATADGQFTDRGATARSVRATTEAALQRAVSGAGPVVVQNVAQVGGHRFDLHAVRTLGSTTVSYHMADLPELVQIRMPGQDAVLGDGHGVITRMENAVAGLPALIDRLEQSHTRAMSEVAQAREGLGAPFPGAEELTTARATVQRLTDRLEASATGRDSSGITTSATVPKAPTSDKNEPSSEKPGSGLLAMKETLRRLREEHERGVTQTDNPGRYDHRPSAPSPRGPHQ